MTEPSGAMMVPPLDCPISFSSGVTLNRLLAPMVSLPKASL